MENKVQIKPNIPLGWCSWYHYYTHINPENLLSNIRKLHEIKDNVPLNLIQIDDGFEKGIGDWLEYKPEFSSGFEFDRSGNKNGWIYTGIMAGTFHRFSCI